jgi:hypothetical protein
MGTEAGISTALNELAVYASFVAIAAVTINLALVKCARRLGFGRSRPRPAPVSRRVARAWRVKGM